MTALVQSLLKGSAAALTSYVRWTVFNVLWIALAINLYLIDRNDGWQYAAHWTLEGAIAGFTMIAVFIATPVAALTALLAVLFGGLK